MKIGKAITMSCGPSHLKQICDLEELTIIVITCDNFLGLKNTLNSLRGKLDNVLVINGGSCLESIKYLESNCIEHISEPDGGISDAFNKGIGFVKTEYLAFLNSGDYIKDFNYYRTALKCFKNSNLDLVVGSVWYEDFDVGLILHKCSQNLYHSFSHQSFVYKKNAAENYLFNLKYKFSMDFDQVVRMLKAGLNIQYVLNPVSVVVSSGGISYTHLYSVWFENLRSLIANKVLNVKAYCELLKRFIKIPFKKLFRYEALNFLARKYKKLKCS